ncbi:hypothetical protein EF879_20550 [Micromonospora sp. HM5-17]|nr:hypothetical protein EF879_20550 [Micromonospora sp. HM5-17]
MLDTESVQEVTGLLGGLLAEDEERDGSDPVGRLLPVQQPRAPVGLLELDSAAGLELQDHLAG